MSKPAASDYSIIDLFLFFLLISEKRRKKSSEAHRPLDAKFMSHKIDERVLQVLVMIYKCLFY